MTDIEQLKAAALAAMPYPAGDELLECEHCIEKFNTLANPAAILALIERLQVAEDAAKDAPEDRDIDAYLDDLGIPEISDVPLEYDRSIWRACEQYHGIAARR